MLRVCSRCGKIHDKYQKCYKGQKHAGDERQLRDLNAWDLKSKQVRDEAHYLCEVCREAGVINYQDLEVHHIEKLKDQPDLLLEDTNLVCLCREHHKQADKGEITKEHLKELALRRLGVNTALGSGAI